MGLTVPSTPLLIPVLTVELCGFPSSGPLGYLSWHSAWFCFSSPCEPLCPHCWILQRQVSVLHTLSPIRSYSEELCRLLCSALTPLPSVCPVVFGFLISFFFSGCPEMLKELLTTPGKLIKTFQTERLLAAASFPFLCHAHSC